MAGTRPQPLKLIAPIHRATHRIGLHIAQMSELGVTQPEAHILDHLVCNGDSTVGQLHAAFAHRRSTLTSVLDRLAEKKLIAREASEADRRTFVIRLTPAGKSLAMRLQAPLRELEAKVLALVSARDVDGFTKVLAALEEVLGNRGDESA
jgi:DNA-binding MarR family transcriptional regulator